MQTEMMETELSPVDQKNMEAALDKAAEMLNEGKPDDDIRSMLMARNFDAQSANETVLHMKQLQSEVHEEDSGGSGMSWLFYIGGLGLVNLLSYLFDWSFWIY